jgi:hypothetical protein
VLSTSRCDREHTKEPCEQNGMLEVQKTHSPDSVLASTSAPTWAVAGYKPQVVQVHAMRIAQLPLVGFIQDVGDRSNFCIALSSAEKANAANSPSLIRDVTTVLG